MVNRSQLRLRRRAVGMFVALAAVVAACSDDGGTTTTESSTTTVAEDPTTTTAETTTTGAPDPVPTGPAPGVTDEEIAIGVTYVDTESLTAVGLNYDLGEHQAVYQALIDDINEAGGIHGRQVRPVFAAIDPTGPLSADEACSKLTEDDDVFLVTGFFLADAVLCPVELHETAVVGGGMTPQRLERAKAPWVSWLPDTDQPVQIIRTLAERGDLDGNMAVYATALDEETMTELVLPTLAELGIEPVADAIMDADQGDVVATESAVTLIAERFESEGADTVVLVGASGATWPQYLADRADYRPRLLFLQLTAARAFATNETTTDTSILDGSLSAGGYGPDQARFEEPAMQECVATLAARGVDTPEPVGFSQDDTSNQPYQAAFQACPDLALTRALLTAAGEELNYGTLAAAVEGLEVHIPGDPIPRTYGPPPAADGDPTAYFFGWDGPTRDFVLETS